MFWLQFKGNFGGCLHSVGGSIWKYLYRASERQKGHSRVNLGHKLIWLSIYLNFQRISDFLVVRLHQIGNEKRGGVIFLDISFARPNFEGVFEWINAEIAIAFSKILNSTENGQTLNLFHIFDIVLRGKSHLKLASWVQRNWKVEI